MNDYIKKFIEKHIDLLDSPSTYDYFFDIVYDQLTEVNADKLLEMLAGVDMNFEQAAKDNFIKHFKDVFENVWLPEYRGEAKILYLKPFIHKHMQHTNGIIFDEALSAVTEFIATNYPEFKVKVDYFEFNR